jgi:hypothetical protein
MAQNWDYGTRKLVGILTMNEFSRNRLNTFFEQFSTDLDGFLLFPIIIKGFFPKIWWISNHTKFWLEKFLEINFHQLNWCISIWYMCCWFIVEISYKKLRVLKSNPSRGWHSKNFHRSTRFSWISSLLCHWTDCH